MTLILSRSGYDYALQVTDRLVTEGKNPFDPLANKNILYYARNAVVTMAYTGFAFLGHVTTDQWIVEQVMGSAFDRGCKLPTFSGVRWTRWLDLGLSMNLLKQKLESAATDLVPPKWRDQWIAKSFHLVVVGWQWGRGRFRPVTEWLSKDPGSTGFEIGRIPRHSYLKRRTTDGAMQLSTKVGAAPPENITLARRQALADALQYQPADEAEALMAATIQEVSLKVPEVGPHCMSILIHPPSIGRARVRFLPAVPHEAELKTASGSRILTVAYSPWLVGPGLVAAPALLAGGGTTEVSLGPYAVLLEGPPNAPDLPVIHFSQSRPKAP